MSRYIHIDNASFDGQDLPFVLSVHLARRCEPLPVGADNDAFPTGAQHSRPAVTAELRMRGTAIAETLQLGRTGVLEFTVLPAAAQQPHRRVQLPCAMLYAVELDYQQSTLAAAVLRFAAVSTDGLQDPVQAEDDNVQA